jgi:hypothetical protein
MTEEEHNQADALATDIAHKVKTTENNTVIPDITCPLIDEVVASLKDSIRALERAVLRGEDDLVTAHIEEALTHLNSVRMEPIRVANDKLRELGRKWYVIAVEISEEVTTYNYNTELT